MATTSKRSRTGRANVWEFLLELSGNPAIVKLVVFVTASILVCIAWIVGLQGRSFSGAGWTVGPQPTSAAPAATATNPPPATPLPAALAGPTSPSSTSTPIPPVATNAPAVEVPPTQVVALPECPPLVAPLPRNAELITCAWGFWNDGRDVEAIAVAEQCIADFEGQALRDQRALSLGGQPAPIIGRPGSQNEKDEILARGVLNDVAACHFVKGRASERLGRTDEAKEEYRAVLQFPLARVWDAGGEPGGLGFFWSPAQAATDRLASLP